MQLRRICALAGAVSVLLPVALARAGAPATVTVRVEGATRTLLPATAVTTTTAPVVKDGKPEDACSGTNAIGALEVATGGNWSGTWFASFGEYSVEEILGESHSFGSGAFWDFWLGHREATQGACAAEVQAGEEVLFFPCPETAKECATLGVEAPASANVGEPVSVTVKRYSPSGVASPQAGAAVGYEGTQATTNESGQATVTPARAGALALVASAPEIVRAEASICVHNGDDGTCGTGAPASSPGGQGSGGEQRGESAPYRGPYAVVSRMTNVSEGHVYSRRNAPRLLQGTVVAHTGIASVSLELRRSYRGRCSAFDGVAAEFRRARCGHGSFFVVAHGASFSYLLPAALAPGRYVLDSEATDAVGNHTTLARGTTRVVFYVR